MLYKKNDYSWMARQRRSALIQIAEELGKQHPITLLMGSASYGRSEFEHGPSTNLATEVRWMAGLDGMVSVLKTWARINNDDQAMRVICRCYPTNYSLCPDNQRKRDEEIKARQGIRYEHPFVISIRGYRGGDSRGYRGRVVDSG